MRKAVRFSAKSSLSAKQLFFLSKAQISNSTFIFGNMYSLHFAHYLRLDSSCKKGALSLEEEFDLLEVKLRETSGSFLNVSSSSLNLSRQDSLTSKESLASKNSVDSCDGAGSESSSGSDERRKSECEEMDTEGRAEGEPSAQKSAKLSSSPAPDAQENSNDSKDAHSTDDTSPRGSQSDTSSIISKDSAACMPLESEAMHKTPSSPVPHKNSIAVCLAPGLPFLLQNFQRYSVDELNDKVLDHLSKLENICREYNKMMIVIGYLPVYKGNFLKREEAAKINDILMTLDNYYSKHEMFRNKFIQYFQVSKVLKSPDMRKCGIYPTSNSYLLIGEKLQEFIFSLSAC